MLRLNRCRDTDQNVTDQAGGTAVSPARARATFWYPLSAVLCIISMDFAGNSVLNSVLRVAGAADVMSAPQILSSNGSVFSRLHASRAITPFFVNGDMTFDRSFESDIDYKIGEGFVFDTADISIGVSEQGDHTLSFYGTYFRDNFFVDGALGFGRDKYDLERNLAYTLRPDGQRNINQTPLPQNPDGSAEAEAEQFFVGVGMGYRFSKGAFSFTPSLHFDYADVDFAEAGESDFNDFNNSDSAVLGQRFQSLTSIVGGQMAYAMDQSWGVLVPFGRIEWIHEFEDDSSSYSLQALEQNKNNAYLGSDESDRNFVNFGLGVSAEFGSGRAAFLSYEQVFGKEDTDQYSITGGLRFEF